MNRGILTTCALPEDRQRIAGRTIRQGSRECSRIAPAVILDGPLVLNLGMDFNFTKQKPGVESCCLSSLRAMGARFCRSADTPGTALGSYTARDDGCDNDSSSSLRLLQPHPLHSGSILGIASVPHSPTLTSPLPGRRAIFTCSDDKCIAVVDETIEPGKESEAARSWEPARAVLLPCHDKAVNRLAAGSNSLFSCSRDLAVKHWRISNGEDGGPTSLSLVQSFDKAHDLTIADIATNSDGSVLCSGSRDYSVRVWDVASGKCAHEYRAPRNVVTSLLLAGGDALSQHPSPGLLYQASEDLCVRVWDYRAPARQPAVHITGFVYFPLCLALRPDGLALATGSEP